MKKEIKYISGKLSVKNTNWNDIPIGTILDVSNPKGTIFSNKGGYHWVYFTKINDKQWQISSVWFVNQTKTYVEVKDGDIYTLDEIFNMAEYTCFGSTYKHTDIHTHIPLYKDNGDMNVLKIIEQDYCEFNKHISLLPLLKEAADDYSRTYIKFRYDQDNSLTINIVRGSNKYYINLGESQFDEFCSRNNLRIRRDAFNTYF
mgnify:CR=1 FL=1